MSQDQIHLPGPDGHAWERKLSNAQGVYWEDPAIYGVDVTHPEYTWEGIYKATTVRRLIAEAVAAERERATEEANRRANASWSLMAKKMVEAEREDCIAALDALEGWSYDDPASSAIAAIRSRGDQT